MNAGGLDRRIDIERYTVTENPIREEVKTWEILDTVWASVEQLTASERIRIGRIEAQEAVTFTIRHRDDLTTEDAVQWQGERHYIHGIQEVQRRKGLELLTTRAEHIGEQ